MRCEDFPCCGHTDLDPCGPQWYDAPGAFDTSLPGNEHALCEHSAGYCDVDPFDDGFVDMDEFDAETGGDGMDDEPFIMEDQWLDSYMEDRISGMYGE